MSTAVISLSQTARTSTPVAFGSHVDAEISMARGPQSRRTALLRSVSRESQMGRVVQG